MWSERIQAMRLRKIRNSYLCLGFEIQALLSTLALALDWKDMKHDLYFLAWLINPNNLECRVNSNLKKKKKKKTLLAVKTMCTQLRVNCFYSSMFEVFKISDIIVLSLFTSGERDK